MLGRNQQLVPTQSFSEASLDAPLTVNGLHDQLLVIRRRHNNLKPGAARCLVIDLAGDGA
ncbi:hypothetical protein D3C81_2056480 [compost metagenome]